MASSIDKIINTPDGRAVIVGFEEFRNCKRVLVKHINPPEKWKDWKSVAYFVDEVKELNEAQI